jgi:hypothetical protein
VLACELAIFDRSRSRSVTRVIIGLREGLIECVSDDNYRSGSHKPNQKIVIGTDDDIAAAVYGP